MVQQELEHNLSPSSRVHRNVAISLRTHLFSVCSGENHILDYSAFQLYLSLLEVKKIKMKKEVFYDVFTHVIWI